MQQDSPRYEILLIVAPNDGFGYLALASASTYS
jgi:hypothetical protein